MQIKVNKLKELDIVQIEELKLEEGVVVPFVFKASNILDLEPQMYRASNTYNAEYVFQNRMQYMDDIFSDIDLVKFELSNADCEELKLKEEFSIKLNKNNNYYFEDIQEFTKFLFRYYINNSKAIELISNFVHNKRMDVFKKFHDTMCRLLGLGVKQESMTEEYMDLRILETSYYPFFKENVGKAIQDYSIREVLLRRGYFTRKTELDIMKQKREIQALKEAQKEKTSL